MYLLANELGARWFNNISLGDARLMGNFTLQRDHIYLSSSIHLIAVYSYYRYYLPDWH